MIISILLLSTAVNANSYSNANCNSYQLSNDNYYEHLYFNDDVVHSISIEYTETEAHLDIYYKSGSLASTVISLTDYISQPFNYGTEPEIILELCSPYNKPNHQDKQRYSMFIGLFLTLIISIFVSEMRFVHG